MDMQQVRQNIGAAVTIDRSAEHGPTRGKLHGVSAYGTAVVEFADDNGQYAAPGKVGRYQEWPADRLSIAGT